MVAVGPRAVEGSAPPMREKRQFQEQRLPSRRVDQSQANRNTNVNRNVNTNSGCCNSNYDSGRTGAASQPASRLAPWSVRSRIPLRNQRLCGSANDLSAGVAPPPY